MTSEAPERIGAVQGVDGIISADHALELVAEAYEAAGCCTKYSPSLLHQGDCRHCGHIEANHLTPADALAAREARDKKIREEALRGAAREAVARDWGTSDPRDKVARRIAKDILALIEGDTE